MFQQAEATYRAALDQAHASQHAAHDRWLRGIRRDAYVAFLSALDEVERLASQPEHLETGAGSPLAAASRALRSALAVLELEGPAPLTALAATAGERCTELISLAERLAPRARALRTLAAAIDTTPVERATPQSPAALALAAHLALTHLHEAVHQPDPGRMDQDAYDAAHERASSSLEACGLFTSEERRAVLTDPSWERSLARGRRHATAIEQLAEARTAFVEVARDHLAGEAHHPAPGG